MSKNKNTVIELFAGVGGFRLGLEPSGWKTVFANQWEPGKKTQWAFDCYNQHFTQDSINCNKDIATVSADEVPNHTLLVGGFPCQDYSVASTLANSKGIQGKKGVLWWEINRLVEAKQPKFILLENVDRLLKSPAKQLGRDFGIILACLNNLGYSVEWRVINAAEYGFAQRRRRTFIFATRSSKVQKKLYSEKDYAEILTSKGFFTSCFPATAAIENGKIKGKQNITVPSDLVEVSDNFNTLFEGSGICINHKAHTLKVEPNYNGPFKTLGDVIESNVDEGFYIKDSMKSKWEYLKGSKKEKRVAKNGHEYFYSEGPIAYPDYLDKPSRTMLTGESSVNRSTHVIEDPQTHRLRLLTPVECERLDGFPDNWTNTGMPQKFRYFCMGNALVVGLIEIMGKKIMELNQ